MLTSTPMVGRPLDRVDGKLKVTGRSRYAADAPIPPEHVAHAVIVQSTIAKGRVISIDAADATQTPGVLVVLTGDNMPRLREPKPDFMKGGVPAEPRLPLSDATVYYAGQHVAVVVAKTPEAARRGAAALKITYSPDPPTLDFNDAAAPTTQPAQDFGEDLQVKRGDVDAALAQPGLVTVKQTYTTPVEHHNPMEMSATVAWWNADDELTVWDATQYIMGTQAVLAEAFGIPREKVHVLDPFVGGGFGCKGFQWPHTILAAAAAKVAGTPVKLMLTRPQMFTSCGHRPATRQAMTLAATPDGKLQAIRHETRQSSSELSDYVEGCGKATSRILYACANVSAPHTVAKINRATPTPMRAPGENPGTFALESAMDELAEALKIDPVQLRLINHADVNPHKNQPWSSKYLRQCYQFGADQFGWDKRNSQPRSTRDDQGRLVGWGMATATYPGYRFGAMARVRLNADGTAEVGCATHDLGTGAYTVFTQISADALGLPPEKITFQLGDSSLPYGPVAGGSNSTATVSQAILDGVDALRDKLIDLATRDAKSPLNGLRPEQITSGPGVLAAKDDPSRTDRWTDIVARAGRPMLEVTSAMSMTGKEREQFAFQSFGCHFVEVRVDEPIARARVTRVVSVMDIGRVINPKTARSQVMGGVIMGIGQALMEATEYDPRTGRPVTDSLADYPVCVNADIHAIEPHFIDQPDPHINALGCRGVGEIGITGVAAAVANAIYHATGKRQRDLPITPDKLLGNA